MSHERVEERVRAHLAGRGAGVVSAYLFGSVAEGRAHRESDVDVGRRVHCADTEADHAYVRDVQLRAADLAPWLRRVRRVKLDALRS